MILFSEKELVILIRQSHKQSKGDKKKSKTPGNSNLSIMAWGVAAVDTVAALAILPGSETLAV
tara:strand:+ start:2450 stop:2638 length:189 start_codon:yes stop_codon:yes gene_type:complete